MSSLLSAGLYIADSEVEIASISMLVLSSVIQTILDKYRYTVAGIHTDILGFREATRPPKSGNIVGLSLGDGKIQMLDGRDIHNNIRGVPGKIELLYETDTIGERIPLSVVQSVSRKRIIPPSLIKSDEGARNKEIIPA